MDDLLQSVGEFGRFQYKTVVIIGLISALTSGCIYATIFIAAEPDFKCAQLNQSLNKIDHLDYEQTCQVWSNIKNQHNQNETSNYTCYFDKHYYDKTIITEYNLVCDRQYLAGLTQTSHILGSTFGFCGGIIGDKYGRRKSTLLFSFLLTACLIFSQSLLSINSINIDMKYVIYTTSQFFIGLLVNCLYCTAYVLLMEFTTEKYRTKIANLNSYIYVLGELIVAIVYYISRDWDILCWFIAFYSFVLLVLSYYFLPESPAWLITSKRSDEAYKVLKKIARFNGKKNFLNDFKQEKLALTNSSTSNSLESTEIDEFDNLNNIKKLKDDSQAYDVNNWKSSLILFKNIFVPRKVLVKTSLLFYVWVALMLLYYGISLGVTNVDLVDPYLMYFLSTFAELLGYIFCYLNDVFGRKKTISGFFFVTALVYGFIAYLTMDDSGHFSMKAILLLVLSLLGKCAISGAYNLIYIYTSELYPAEMRNTALIFLVCFGGTSSLVAPQINMLKSLIWNPLPYIIYSVCSLLSCLCIWYLPETHSN